MMKLSCWCSLCKNREEKNAGGNMKRTPDHGIIVQNLVIIMSRVIIESNTHSDTPETHFLKQHTQEISLPLRIRNAFIQLISSIKDLN